MTDTATAPALKPAEENPWYLLATLYGEPARFDEEHQTRNRVAWNRYFASQWSDADRARLKGRVPDAELLPFSQYELDEIHDDFVRRVNSRDIILPNPDEIISFSDYYFQNDVGFGGYIFESIHASGAVFSGYADFSNATFTWYAFFDATFLENANFTGASFPGEAYFAGAAFSGYAAFSGANFFEDTSFRSAIFSGIAYFRSATFSGNARLQQRHL